MCVPRGFSRNIWAGGGTQGNLWHGDPMLPPFGEREATPEWARSSNQAVEQV